MSQKKWHVCIGEDVFGPLDTKTVHLMLNQSRLQFTDFIWQEGMHKWHRISETDDFIKMIPAYPTMPIPGSNAKAVDPKPHKAEPIAEPAKPAKSKTAQIAPAPEPEPPKIRATDRVMVTGKVRIDGAGQFDIVDLSLGGLFVTGNHMLKVGSDIKFHLQIKGLLKPLDMTGIVVRHGSFGKNAGFGIEFTRPNPAHLRALMELMTTLHVGQAG